MCARGRQSGRLRAVGADRDVQRAGADAARDRPEVQLYVTIGGGYYRIRYESIDVQDSGFGTNVGGGVKIDLVGPLRLRLDYRVFKLTDRFELADLDARRSVSTRGQTSPFEPVHGFTGSQVHGAGFTGSRVLHGPEPREPVNP